MAARSLLAVSDVMKSAGWAHSTTVGNFLRSTNALVLFGACAVVILVVLIGMTLAEMGKRRHRRTRPRLEKAMSNRSPARSDTAVIRGASRRGWRARWRR